MSTKLQAIRRKKSLLIPHLNALLDKLDYDFTQFSIEDFIKWMEAKRSRKIVLVPWALPAGYFGAGGSNRLHLL